MSKGYTTSVSGTYPGRGYVPLQMGWEKSRSCGLDRRAECGGRPVERAEVCSDLRMGRNGVVVGWCRRCLLADEDWGVSSRRKPAERPATTCSNRDVLGNCLHRLRLPRPVHGRLRHHCRPLHCRDDRLPPQYGADRPSPAPSKEGTKQLTYSQRVVPANNPSESSVARRAHRRAGPGRRRCRVAVAGHHLPLRRTRLPGSLPEPTPTALPSRLLRTGCPGLSARGAAERADVTRIGVDLCRRLPVARHLLRARLPCLASGCVAPGTVVPRVQILRRRQAVGWSRVGPCLRLRRSLRGSLIRLGLLLCSGLGGLSLFLRLHCGREGRSVTCGVPSTSSGRR
ncbi:hypothetical protein J2X81_001321 [Sinomonas atrocyanea]|nr:hypothetical protein [Sinomonas atrocyanea]